MSAEDIGHGGVAANTDRELWRQPTSPSPDGERGDDRGMEPYVYVTEEGRVGMCHYGTCCESTIEGWVKADAVRAALAPLVDGTGRDGPADADDPAALLAREVRRQCAEEVRAVATSIEAGNLYDEPLPAAVAKELRALAASWDEEPTVAA